MPSKKGMEQALTWLKGKAAERNTLDGVNAELCINVIMDLQRQYEQLGARYGNLANYKKKMDELKMQEQQMSFLVNAMDDGK